MSDNQLRKGTCGVCGITKPVPILMYTKGEHVKVCQRCYDYKVDKARYEAIMGALDEIKNSKTAKTAPPPDILRQAAWMSFAVAVIIWGVVGLAEIGWLDWM